MAQKTVIQSTFPDKSVKESAKDEEYHRRAVRAIMGNSLSTQYPEMRDRILLCQQYFNGTQNDGEFEHITSGGITKGTGDERTMPAQWINFQDIRNRVELLIGELEKRGFEVEVNAINREAKSKKLEFKKRAIARIRMRPINEKLAEISGVPLGLGETEVPWELEELEDFMQSSYKSTEERVVQAALEYNLELYKWKYKRLHQFRDILIGGMCFSVSEIRNGYPQLRIIQPENVVWDYNATDDFLTDSQFFGEIEYQNAEDLIERYGLDMDDIQEVYDKYVANRPEDKYLWRGLTTKDGSGNTRLFQPFLEEAGSMRVLVFRACWLDIAPKSVKVTYDPYGNEHVHILDEEDKSAKLTKKEKENGGYIETRRIAVVRYGHLLGGDMMVEWGVMPNQPRDIDNPSETRLPYKALIPNYVNYEPISKVWELKSLQDFKNMLMFKVQHELATSGRKGFTFNTKYIPQGFEFNDIIYNMKAHGIIPTFYDEESMGAGDRMIEPFDNSISQAIGQYVQLANVLKAEMDSISGINPARQGQSVSGREGLGVTQMQLVQSSTMTEKLFSLFYQYESRVFQGHVDMIKIAWPENPEKFSPIVGDLGIDLLKEDIGVDLNDYGIFVHVNPPIARDREQFEAMVQQSISTGFPLDIAIKVLMEKDLKRAIALFEREMRKHRKESQQFQMQMKQMEAQAAQQQKQMDVQGRLAETKMEGEYDLAEAKLKKEYDKESYAMKDAADMRKERIGVEMDLLGKALENERSE